MLTPNVSHRFVQGCLLYLPVGQSFSDVLLRWRGLIKMSARVTMKCRWLCGSNLTMTLNVRSLVSKEPISKLLERSDISNLC